jgi:hypothetical protein
VSSVRGNRGFEGFSDSRDAQRGTRVFKVRQVANFREHGIPEARFPRRQLSGNLVNSGSGAVPSMPKPPYSCHSQYEPTKRAGGVLFLRPLV